MKFEIELNAEQKSLLNTLKQTREGRTDKEILTQCLEHGLKNIAYRTKRNKDQWSQFKAWKQTQKQ